MEVKRLSPVIIVDGLSERAFRILTRSKVPSEEIPHTNALHQQCELPEENGFI